MREKHPPQVAHRGGFSRHGASFRDLRVPSTDHCEVANKRMELRKPRPPTERGSVSSSRTASVRWSKSTRRMLEAQPQTLIMLHRKTLQQRKGHALTPFSGGQRKLERHGCHLHCFLLLLHHQASDDVVATIPRTPPSGLDNAVSRRTRILWVDVWELSSKKSSQIRTTSCLGHPPTTGSQSRFPRITTLTKSLM